VIRLGARAFLFSESADLNFHLIRLMNLCNHLLVHRRELLR